MVWKNDLNLFLFVTGIILCNCNKYSEDVNSQPDRQFRMLKVQQLWGKAQKVMTWTIAQKLSGQVLADLYADLVIQDQAERELKKVKAKDMDKDGFKEAEVNENFVKLIHKYGLEDHYPNIRPDPSKNEIPEDATQGKLTDKRLQKLWKKAKLSGFSDEELNKLKQEFWHQQLKLDEYNALKDEMISMEDIMDNTIESQDKMKTFKEKNTILKQKNRDLKEGYDKLAGLAAKDTDDLDFKDIRVYELWTLARKANMSDEELNSLKEELKHFEHRIKKHEYLQEQLLMSETEMKEKHKDGIYPEKHKQLEETARTYEKRVHKYHADIKKRVEKAIAAHSEL